MSFDFDELEKSNIVNMLNNFTIIDTSEDIASQCLKNRERKKIKIPDNIIVSTAQVNNLVLVSRNIKDFKDLNIEVLNIFESNL